MNKKIIIKTVAAYIFIFAANSFNALFYIPYLLKQLGSEAFAYYPLSVTVINFASVITVITTSMLSAFLIENKRTKKAYAINEFINSALISNLLTAVVISVPIVLFSLFSDRILDVPERLSKEVNILFLLTGTTFLTAQIRNSFTVLMQASGNKYLINSQKASEKIISTGIAVILFSFMKPSLVIVGTALFSAGVIRFLITLHSSKKIFPELKISGRYINRDIYKKLFTSGGVNSLVQLIFMLSLNSGAIISNLIFGPKIQSAYSLGGQLPGLFGIMLIYLMNSFIFFLAVLYKNRDYKNLSEDTVSMLKVTSQALGIISAVFCVFGDIFLKLWLGIHYGKTMYIIMILSSASLMISGSFYVIYSIIVVFNRVKLPAVFMLITEILSVFATFFVSGMTNSIYSVSSIHLITVVIQFLGFIPVYFSKKTNTDIRLLYRGFFFGVLTFGITTAVSVIIKYLFYPNSFLKLLAVAISAVIISSGTAFLLFFKREDADITVKIIKANTEYRNDSSELQGRDYDSLL